MTLRRAAEPLGTLSDEELMRRVQADDLRAFEALYDRYSAQSLGLARGVCSGSQRAEDAVQESFLSVWRSRASYDPARGGAGAWLLMMVRHRSIDTMRQAAGPDRHWATEERLGSVPASSSVADDAERRDQGDRLLAMLHDLPDGQRDVITLAYFGGLSHTEIAARLELPAGTVKGRMRLGLNRIRGEIDADQAARENRGDRI